MAREILNNGDSGLSFRTKLNSNFQQLFASVVQAPIAGRWLIAAPGGATVAAGVNASASLWLYPFILNEQTTISALGMRVTTGAAGVSGMLGIYAHSPTTGEPTGPVLASVIGLTMANALSVSAALSANVTLQPGIYWAAFQASGAAAIAQFIAASEVGLICTASGSPTLNEVTNGPSTVMVAKGVVNTYGAFPNLTGASLTPASARNGALLAYKVA